MRLSEEHEDFRAAVAEFAAEQLAPHVARWNAAHELPLEAVKQMADFGLFGLNGPEEYGGAGDFTSLCVAIEEIGRVDQSLGITLEAAVGLGSNPIAAFGTPEQKQRWLPDLLAGHALAAFGLTEPDAGSDASATQTTAVRSDDGWLINGSKQFITNSGTDITSVITVTARTGAKPDGRAEISTLLVPAGTPGLAVGPAYDKLGWHASDTHPLSLADVRVPEDALLGERGKGYSQFLSILDDGRVAIAALALGCIRACRDLARRLRPGAALLRRPDRPQAGGGLRDRRPGRDGPHRRPARLRRGDGQGRRCAGRGVQAGGVDRQALLLGVRGLGDPDRHPGVRWLRLHGGVPDRPLLPRRQGAGDR